MKFAPIISAVLAAAAFTLSSCSKDEEKSPPAQDPGYYFKGTVDGQPLVLKDGENGYLHNEVYDMNAAAGSFYLDIGSQYNPAQANTNSYAITIREVFSEEPTLVEVKGIWQVATYPFQSLSGSSSGAQINFHDKDGKHWNSAYGDQTGSTFTVTAVADYFDYNRAQICQGSFTCKLYSPQGEVKTITDGSFRGIVPYK